MNKKNISIWSLVFFISFSIISSIISRNDNKNKIENLDNTQKVVLSTTGIINSIVEEITQGVIPTKTLMGRQMDPHSYEIRKGDKEKIQSALIVFANGLSLEHNPSLFYQLKKNNAVFLGDDILKDFPELIIGDRNEVDPHIWMDLKVMMKLVNVVSKHLMEKDPVHKEIYQENTIILVDKMESLHNKIEKKISSIPKDKRYLVTTHDAFQYFVRRYFKGDHQSMFSIQGLSPDSEISLFRMKSVLDFINQNKIKTIFWENNLPKDTLVKLMEISKDSGLDIKIASNHLYGDTLGDKTYLEMMDYNAEIIAQELKGEGIDNEKR